MGFISDNKINIPTLHLDTYNPLLTGNVKVVVDSKEDIYLQSIDANETLSQRVFKHIAIEEKLGYGAALFNYMKMSADLTKDKIYDNRTQIQQPLKEIYFPEAHSLFAPLSINKIEELPNYYIVFKVSNKYTSYTDVIKQGVIVKTFDLKNSRLGTLFNNTTIPHKIMEKDYFNPDRYYLYGIDYRYGTTNQYQIFYNDNGKSNTTIFNELTPKLSDLFLISLHYYNLCFLFDDTTKQADEYYVGYYFYNISENIVKLNLDKFKYQGVMANNYHDVASNILMSDVIPIKSELNLQTTEDEICVIENKNKEFFNIQKYSTDDDNIQIHNNNVDLSNFFGTIQNSGVSIRGNILNGKDYANLALTLNVTEAQTMHNGDYIAIKPGILNYEWRVIISDTNCCFDDEFCYHSAKKIRYLANIDNIEEYDGVNSIVLSVNDLVDITEGEYIVFSTNKINNAKTEIIEVHYDIDNKKTIFTILDYGKKFMDYVTPLTKIEFIYKEPSYYYVFVNPNGDSSYVAHKIVNGFERFTNRTFNIVHQKNTIIFSANDKGESFANYKFIYDFSKSNTNLNLFKINNVTLQGKSYKNNSENIVITRKRNVIGFTGGSLYGTPMRFFVEKNYNFPIDLDAIVFETKKGCYPLKSYYIDGNLTYKSNYLEEKKTDSTFKNIDKYDVYTINSDNDTLIKNSMFQLSAFKKYDPKIRKLKILANAI